MAKKDITNEIKNEIKDSVLKELDKEIKKTITSNTENYREMFTNDIKKQIEEEVSKSVKKEEKRIIRKKNFAIFRKNIVIVLLLIIICYLLFLLYKENYFQFLVKNCDTKEVINSYEEIENNEIVKDEKWYIDNYSYLLNNATTKLNTDNINSYYLYSTSHKIENIKNNYLLNIAIKNINEKEIKKSGNKIIIQNDTVKDNFEKIFNVNYSPTNFEYKCYKFEYNNEKNIYESQYNNCIDPTKEIIEEIETIYEKDNNIIINTHASIFDNDEKAYYSFDNLYTPIIENSNKDDFKNNSQKFNKYEYIFKLDNNNYYLQEINKLN